MQFFFFSAKHNHVNINYGFKYFSTASLIILWIFQILSRDNTRGLGIILLKNFHISWKWMKRNDNSQDVIVIWWVCVHCSGRSCVVFWGTCSLCQWGCGSIVSRAVVGYSTLPNSIHTILQKPGQQPCPQPDGQPCSQEKVKLLLCQICERETYLRAIKDKVFCLIPWPIQLMFCQACSLISSAWISDKKKILHNRGKEII